MMRKDRGIHSLILVEFFDFLDPLRILCKDIAVCSAYLTLHFSGKLDILESVQTEFEQKE
jgi:hypothetical protein